MAQKITVTTGKPIKGKDIFYFIQSVHAKIGDNAILPAYRTDGNTTLGGDFSDEQTQQGRLLEKTTNEHSIELTQYFAPADPSVKIIEDAQRLGESVKVWEVTVSDAVEKEGKYPAKFGYGKVDEISKDDGVEDLVEINYTLNIVGMLQDGMFPLSKEEVNFLQEVYAYQNPGETTGDYDNISKNDVGGDTGSE